jgi:O-antigen/teichoic acid export membrane protein
MVLSAVVNLGCNVLLIPLYGPYGAVAAMAISNVVPFLQDWFHPRMRLNLKQTFLGAISFWKVVDAVRSLDRR